MEMLSVAEAAARQTRADHSTATVTILYSRKDKPSTKAPIGSGFVIKLDQGQSKIMTCLHVLEAFEETPNTYDLWVRYFKGKEDAPASVKYQDIDSDLALIDAPLVETLETVTTLQFSKRRKIGTDVVMLGYFNPVSIDDYLKRKNVIAKEPNAVPGVITGPIKIDINNPGQYKILHSCLGIDECSGSPIISYKTGKIGKVLGVFDSSKCEVHSAISTRTVRYQLCSWLRADPEASLKELIQRL